MSTPGDHFDIGPELRQLAQAILDRLDPRVRAAAAMAGEALRGPGRCEQVWCPVCALAALVSGEQHPLLTVIGEHSVALLGLIQNLVAERPGDAETVSSSDSVGDAGDYPGDHVGDGDAPGDGPPPTSNVRFHHIPIVVETEDETEDENVDADRDVDA